MKSISIVTYLLFRAVHDNRIGPEDTLQSSENEECVDWKIEPQPENSCSVARSFPTLCDPMDLQHSRFPCPSPSSGACPDSWPLVMPSNHHILCHPLLLLRSIFPSISTQLDKWPVTSRTTREARGVPSSRKDEAWLSCTNMQGPCDLSQKWRGTLRFLLQLEMSKFTPLNLLE